MKKIDIQALETLLGRKLTTQEVIDLIYVTGDGVNDILKSGKPEKDQTDILGQYYFKTQKGGKGFFQDDYGDDGFGKPESIFGDRDPKMKPPIENIIGDRYPKMKPPIVNIITEKIYNPYEDFSYKKKHYQLQKNIQNIYDILDFKINNSINKKIFQSISTSAGGFTAKIQPDTMIGARNIADAVFPLVEYIHATQPDCIIACDRGARLIGLAVFKLYQELYGPLPTYNGTVQFRRISKSNPQSETQAHLAPLADELLSVNPNPTVLVLDDWVVSGATKDIVKESFENLSRGRGEVDVKFGVLQGSGADISGNDSKTSAFAGTVDWHDDAVKIGVNYSGMTPEVVSTDTHRTYRTEMMNAIELFAAKKKKERREKTKQENRKKEKKLERERSIQSSVKPKDIPLGSIPIILKNPEGNIPKTITPQDDMFSGEPIVLEEPIPPKIIEGSTNIPQVSID